MRRFGRNLSFVLVTTLLASCGSGGGGSQATAPDATASAAPEAAAPAPAASPAGTEAPAAAMTPAAAAAPAADDTTTTDGTKLADYTPNVDHGKVVFMQCQVCHSRQVGVNKIGPSLANVVGRHSGIIPGYSYSAANKDSGIVWTPEKLFQYLQAPQRVIPGTKMTFAGLPNAQDRADVIAFLKTPPPS